MDSTNDEITSVDLLAGIWDFLDEALPGLKSINRKWIKIETAHSFQLQLIPLSSHDLYVTR